MEDSETDSMTAGVTLSDSSAGESAKQLAVATPPPMPRRHSLERRSADVPRGKLQASGRRPLVRSTSEVSACPLSIQEACSHGLRLAMDICHSPLPVWTQLNVQAGRTWHPRTVTETIREALSENINGPVPVGIPPHPSQHQPFAAAGTGILLGTVHSTTARIGSAGLPNRSSCSIRMQRIANSLIDIWG